MDAENVSKEVDADQLSIDELRAIVREQQRLIEELRRELAAAKRKINQLQDQADRHPTERVDEDYSVDSEEKRRRGGRKKQESERRGRRTTAEKIRQADRTENVVPEGVDPKDAKFVRERFATRLIENQAVRVVYRIFKQPGTSEVPTVPGLLPRCEYGIEVLILIATLVYLYRLSIARTCRLLQFFCGLTVSPSQADSLLNRLAREWEPEFEAIAELLAHQAVVRADETGWSINSVWGFLSETLSVMLFGCRKDAATLATMLPKGTFPGTLISDNASVYDGFTSAQKCWAHLLRKAIRLTLLEPDDARYRTFLDGLLQLYRDACRVKQDRRYKEPGRLRAVRGFEDRLWDLLGEELADASEPADGHAHEFRNLCRELAGLLMKAELFVFVTADEQVTGTNNEMEQDLRDPALCRHTDQTSRTLRGARRRTVIVTVLKSASRSLGACAITLNQLLEHVQSWMIRGRSVFSEALVELGLKVPAESRLDRIYSHAASPVP
jgi:uncharacterized protein YbbK (DUF523 family)